MSANVLNLQSPGDYLAARPTCHTYLATEINAHDHPLLHVSRCFVLLQGSLLPLRFLGGWHKMGKFMEDHGRSCSRRQHFNVFCKKLLSSWDFIIHVIIICQHELNVRCIISNSQENRLIDMSPEWHQC